MANINKPHDFSPSTTISSSQVNDNFDTIYDEFNGNISEANLADGAVTEDKIANSAVTTGKINDAAVVSSKLDRTTLQGVSTNLGSNIVTSATSPITAATLSYDFINGRTYLIFFTCTYASSTGPAIINFATRVNAVTQSQTRSNTTAQEGVCTIQAYTAAATATYTVDCIASRNGGTNVTFESPRLTVVPLFTS